MSDNKKIKLRGHEKFTLREGWLNKGLDAVYENPKVFTNKYATDILGVGSNMVKSIRYWMRAFQLVDVQKNKGETLSELGEIIRKNDPYFEDNFTLWILHSNLVRNEKDAIVWYLFFNKSDFNEINKEVLENHLEKELIMYAGNNDFSSTSLKMDIDVLLAMYRDDKQDENPEDKNYSPLSKLGLIKQIKNQITKESPDLRLLNEWVILYELSCLMEEKDSISIDEAISGENGFGKIYNLTRVSSNRYLDLLDNMGFVKVDRTAGLDIIYKKQMLNPLEVLEYYYGR